MALIRRSRSGAGGRMATDRYHIAYRQASDCTNLSTNDIRKLCVVLTRFSYEYRRISDLY